MSYFLDKRAIILPGDRVIYRPVSEEEYQEIKKRVKEDRFEARILDPIET